MVNLDERWLTTAFRHGSSESPDKGIKDEAQGDGQSTPRTAAQWNKENVMLKKITLAAAVAATSLTALPAAAEARHRDGYYDSGRYERSYRSDRGYRNNGYYGNSRAYRNNGYYNRNYGGNYYNRRGYDDRYYGRRSCSGTTGTIVGGVAGALLGREVDRGGNSRYGRRDSGTTGAIIGGAIGALAGRAIDKADC